ncbi:MAG: PQQ-binding-like beta-propeller repeat protein [Caldilineaceae bacterium]
MLIVFVLALVVGARWVVQNGIAFGPTPTVTSTRRAATETPTADFRATRNIAELATQRAYSLAMAGIDTPTPIPSDTPTWTPTASATLSSIGDPSPTPAQTIIVNIPGPIVLPGATTPAPTPTSPDAGEATPPPVDTAQPTEELPTETATPVVTETPTETPFPTPTPTVTPQPIVSLQAYTLQQAPIYAGPSTRYTNTTQIPVNQRVVLQGRNATGEWIYLCCEENVSGWVRRLFLDIRDNQIPPNEPTDADPNDVRLLVEQQPSATPQTPVPGQTPIPEADYPLFRHDQAGQSNVQRAIAPNWSRQWDSSPLPRAFSSPPIVVSQSVIIANEDGHIYGFDRQASNQRWRYDLKQLVTMSPAAQVANGYLDIYVVDTTGRVVALREQGNSAVQVWSTSLSTPPRSALNVTGDLVFATGQNNRIYALNRNDGALVWQQETAGSTLQYPVVGDDLLFVANQRLTAMDIYNGGQVVWQSREDLFSGVSAPPVYIYPGVQRLAEVYVADNSGVVHAFDAATGEQLWFHVTGRQIEMMAVDRLRLYTVGGQSANAINRNNGQRAWDIQLVAPVAGGRLWAMVRLYL